MDKLQEMLMLQNALQQRLGYNFAGMSYEERVELIKEFSIHANQEMNEMLYELPFFKPWKDYSGMTLEEIEAAFDKARKEFIDFWHFILNIALLLNMFSDDIYKEYVAKNAENHRRQDEGYTHDKIYR